MKFLSIFLGSGRDRPVASLMLLLFGIFFLSLQDTLVKRFSPDLSFWQFQAIRSFGNLSLLIAIAWFSAGFKLIKPKRIRPVLTRAVMLGLCMICFFGAAEQITVAQMAAGLYTYPIFVTLLAKPLLGERVGPWRAGAVMLGMLGSMIVINPLADDFHPLQIMPILAGFFYAINVITLRRYCRRERPLALAFMVGLVFLVFGLIGGVAVSVLPLASTTREIVPFLLIPWPHLTALLIGFCLLTSVLNLTGNVCLSRAYQLSDSSRLAPIDFSYLIFATLWGKLLFGVWPASQVILGMAMIAAAGIITVARERKVTKTITSKRVTV